MSDIEAAVKFKEIGNKAYAENKFNVAIKNYTESLKINRDAKVMGNRAQALLKLRLYPLAQLDAATAIMMDPKFAKNYKRRAEALIGMQLYEEAKKDLDSFTKLEPKFNLKDLYKQVEGKKNIGMFEVEPLESYEFAPDGDLIDVPIEFDENDESNNSRIIKSTAREMPNGPIDFSDFVAALKYLEGNDIMTSEYFLRIESDRYHKLFDDLIDDQLTEMILKSLANYIETASSGRKTEIGEKLLLLSKVNRFDVIILLMNVETKRVDGSNHRLILQISTSCRKRP